MKSYLEEYCNGCGLCSSLKIAKLYNKGNGFLAPSINNENEKWLDKICPTANGYYYRECNSTDIWGTYKDVYLGWALDDDIRLRGSSGGVLTTICLYLQKRHSRFCYSYMCR